MLVIASIVFACLAHSEENEYRSICFMVLAAGTILAAVQH